MSTDVPLAKYPAPRLSRDEVVGYLIPYREKGWEVYKGSTEDQFIVRLAANLKLFIERVDGRWRVSTGLDVGQSLSVWAYPETLGELDSAIQRSVPIATSSVGKIYWSSAPSAVRLNVAEPVSNIGKIAALIGSAAVQAVFDPYLDNKGLEALVNFATLGVKPSEAIRLLTSTKMVDGSLRLPRLTASYARQWVEQIACPHAEFRHNSYAGHQRRFMLLSGGQSLILGPSLNNLKVNEASHLEPDTADGEFFESEWRKATPLTL